MIRYLILGVLVFVLWVVFEHWYDWKTLLFAILFLLLLGFIIRRWGYKIAAAIYKIVNRFIPWHKLPTPLAVLNLDVFRVELREKNLYDMPLRADLEPAQWKPNVLSARTADGSFNDLNEPNMGRAGMHFGHNFPLEHVYPDDASLLDPNPREISRKLLARQTFVPATTLNLLAAAWIQFQVHGWVNHIRSKKVFYEVDIAENDDWPQQDCPMRIGKTVKSTEASHEFPPAYANTVSHWWDQSQIYGNDEQQQRSLRTGKQGKLRVTTHEVGGSQDLRLEPNPLPGLESIDHTGFFDNYWIGLSIFHTVFTLEHNAICDHLATAYPNWDDESLFNTAQLINCALMAKIHTVEWTPGILSHPALKVSMNANWWGLLGENLKKNLGRLSDTEEFSGIIGSDTDHHAASYSLTEEFTAVYRLHPLIPDSINIYSSKTAALLKEKSFTEVQGKFTRPCMEDVSVADIFYSFGITHPGAITLHNYPNTLRNFKRIKADEPLVDLAATDILRDRERGIPRYNEFRKLLHKKPAKSFSDITSNPKWAREIEEIYEGHIDKVDTLVGLLAEDLPEGFGFSDTAFRIFILMASRRLKSDRFFNKDYTEEVYTRIGLDWVDNNGMASVLIRHYPHLAPALQGITNPFAPWNTMDKWKPIEAQD